MKLLIIALQTFLFMTLLYAGLTAYADWRSGYWSAPVEMPKKTIYCEEDDE